MGDVAGRARQRFPDQLRGLALLGIVVVNAPFMAIDVDGYTDDSLATTVDRAAAMLTTLLAEGKFYLIFSFLFGYSATFIVRPGPVVDESGLRRYRRRLIALAALGLAHAVFLFLGDILLSYALLGAILMLAFGWTDRAVLNLALFSYLLAATWLGLLVVGAVVDGSAGAQSVAPELVELNTAMSDGSFLQLALARASALPTTLLTLASVQWGFALAAFALGLVAGRRGYLADPATHRALWRRCAAWGLTLGFAAQALATWLAFADGAGYAQTTLGLVGLGVGFITAPVLAAGYLGGLALLYLRWPSLLAPSESAGRASLSVYLGESVVLCVIFCGWGFGWYGQLGAAAVTAIAAATWGGLALAAWAWLRFHRRGPLEILMSTWQNGGSVGPSAR
ncbi:MAG: DUF418 domain-containing protein [Actinobacteria bacterium]|nr:DUF418 domain-containing protein [Actinomycetota bacterium]